MKWTKYLNTPSSWGLVLMYFNYDIVVKHDLNKLLATRFIQQIDQTTWLSFIMMVSKKNKKLTIWINVYKFSFSIKKDPISFSIYQISPKCNNRPWNLFFSKWILSYHQIMIALKTCANFIFTNWAKTFV
jgi:hypothetical protein